MDPGSRTRGLNRWRLPQAVPTVAVIGLVSAPEETSGSVAVLLAAGALPLTRAFGTIWVNRETSSTVRATVHSLLAQAEHLGVTVCGLAIAAAHDHDRSCPTPRPFPDRNPFLSPVRGMTNRA